MSSSATTSGPESGGGPSRPRRDATVAGAFEEGGRGGGAEDRPRRKRDGPGAPVRPVPTGPAAVVVEGLGKCYHIYNKPEDRLKQALLRWRGKRYFDEFWALRHASFEVMQGEAVGIVGRNGSGKSTLMQIIAGTLAPTEGQVRVRGRVAALLELGSGFNPDFTGRENVFTYGAILGLGRREIEGRFDEIAAFADIGRFLDQPVKTYSSGMKVRLAFAVQIQVRPEVLIIDEALSVGDNLFQKRCHERLRTLRESGTTLLFVSHQQEIIRTLTSRCVLLHQGRVRAVGTPGEVLLDYRRILHEEEKRWTTRRLEAAARVEGAPERTGNDGAEVAGAAGVAPAGLVGVHAEGGAGGAHPAAEADDRRTFGDRDATITGVEILGSDSEGCSLFYPGDRVLIRVRVRFEKESAGINVALRLRDKHGVKICSWGTLNQDIATRAGLRPYDDPTGAGGEHEGDMARPSSVWERRFGAGQEITVEFEWVCVLGAGFYEVQACVSHEATPDYRNQRMLHWLDEAAFFEVKTAREEYFFGGLVDLRMRAEVLD